MSQAHEGTVQVEQYGAEQLEVHLHGHPLSHLPPAFPVHCKETHGKYRGARKGYRAVRRGTCPLLEREIHVDIW